MNAICSLCRQNLPATRVKFDHLTCMVSYDGLLIKLTTTEADILKVLWDARSTTLSHDEIMLKAYGYKPWPEAESAMRVHICNIRRKLANGPVTIANLGRNKYHLQVTA